MLGRCTLPKWRLPWRPGILRAAKLTLATACLATCSDEFKASSRACSIGKMAKRSKATTLALTALHVGVFAELGVLTRLYLDKLFQASLLHTASSQSALH